MLIGAASVGALVAILGNWWDGGAILHVATQRDVAHMLLGERCLGIIAFALILAAGIELAHTLFTDGPDEAIDPLILTLSATLLLQLEKVDNLKVSNGLAAFLYVGALFLLFMIRQHFFPIVSRKQERR